MRIAIDTTPLETGHKDRGVGTYTKLLIDALQKYGKNHSYYFFTRGQKIPNEIELVHYPYFDPFFVSLPFIYAKPTIVTVHDLIPLVFPEHFPPGLRGALGWQYQRKRLARSNRIIVDSQVSKRDIRRITGIPESRIDVVHLAPSPQYQSITDDALLSRVKTKYHLPDKFILYVGDVNWNKNIVGMLEAFNHIKNQKLKIKNTDQKLKIERLKLVLVGRAFLDATLKETQQINSFVDFKALNEEVIRPGGVFLEDLVVIYNLASVYIQPSFYEGFGLPVLEAMASGVPVVSSRAASLAEIAGPAVAIDPKESKDIARGVMEALTLTSPKRSALVGAQAKWVQQYSWERVARQTIVSYEKAAA